MSGAPADLAALLAPPGPPPLRADALDDLWARLSSGVADAAATLPAGAAIEVGLPELRRVRHRPDLLGAPDEPFAWKPLFVRRSLGTAALRACAAGRFRAPAEAVGPVADEAVAAWRASGWRTYHWEPWLAGLGAGGRAAVLAEAVTWATPLWTTLDAGLLGSRTELGRPDDRVTVPGVDGVQLRGRSEARTALDGPDGGPGPDAVLVSMASGYPGDGWADELAFLALVAGLAAPTRPSPVRVVGLWPEAGAVEVVPIDRSALSGAVDRVIDTVAVLVDVRVATATSAA